uniref:AlNc14C286G10184 protein n=1 Tax=Albugo laibachii Nc14 TaxID=890382 RepID=F0WV41_9STRA|nr:AlNc14C286G10184 [Albugo laibachii Nc14]|eukprot:CCA25278.1 AlNc14C286G10184 [Albugo laibachii Nc14]
MNALETKSRSVSLPGGYEACTFHATWIAARLAFMIAIRLDRRRNPEKWKSFPKAMKKKQRILEGMIKENQDATVRSLQQAVQERKELKNICYLCCLLYLSFSSYTIFASVVCGTLQAKGEAHFTSCTVS